MTSGPTFPSRLLAPLRANPVASANWGLAPRNPRRRRRAALGSWFPLFFYFAAGAAFHLVVWWNDRWRGYHRTSAQWREGLIALALLMGLIVVAGYLLKCFEAAPPECRRLLANLDEYRLAGLSGSQMLWGLGGAKLLGALAFAGVHLIWTGWLLAILSAFISAPSHWYERAWVVLPLAAAMSFAAVASAAMDAALWVRMHRLRRGAVAISIGFLASPLLLYVVAGGLARVGYVPYIFMYFKAFAWAEAASWLPRAAAVALAWRRSARWLETGGEI